MGFFDEKTGGLITYWKTISAITDLVGTAANARIYPHAAKQGVSTPFITYVRAEGEPIIRLAGTVGARITTLHVYCYGATLAQADTLAEAVKQNTQTMRGTYSTVTVHRVETDAIDDGFELREPGSDAKDFWVRLVIRIVHSEAGGV